MTVDELLARKRELMAQREAADDEFERALLDEEIHDLNAQLRSMRGGKPAHGTVSGALVMSAAQYQNWLATDRDEEMREAHRVYIDALKSGADTLTQRQRELFELWQRGVSVMELSERFDIDKSTVSRTISRAKTRMREEAERLTKKLKLAGMAVFDLADHDVARVILSCLTTHQAVCIYLYYGEWLNLRDCGELLGIDHTAVLRTVQRGLRAIADTMNMETFTLDNADALSDLAYELYIEQGGETFLPESEKNRNGWARQKLGHRARQRREYPPVPLCAVRTSDGFTSVSGKAHQSFLRPMSKLLRLLFELRAKGTLFRWLRGLFSNITKKRTRGNQHVAVR